jgi:hypothetical protein
MIDKNRRMPRSLVMRIFMTVATCLLVGPLIGLLAFSLISAASRADLFWFGSVPIIVLIGYLCGSVQAILVGIIYSLGGWHLKRIPFWLVVAATAVVSVLASLISFVFSRTGEVAWRLNTLPEFFWVHGIAALVCWLIVKRFWTAPST